MTVWAILEVRGKYNPVVVYPDGAKSTNAEDLAIARQWYVGYPVQSAQAHVLLGYSSPSGIGFLRVNEPRSRPSFDLRSCFEVV